MIELQEIYERAEERHGEGFDEEWTKPKTKRTLKKRDDSYYFAEMTKRVFQSGFVWRIIEAKWDGFEEAFEQFDPDIVRTFNEEQVEQLVQNTAIVRHRKKIESTIKNAQFVHDVAEENGSFGAYIADWKPSDFTGLYADLKKRGGRLGGMTGQYFLRFVGWDAPMLTRDVVAALIDAKVVAKNPTSKRDLAAVQEAFNEWHEETGRSYSEISRILAHSIDAEVRE